MNYLIDTNLHSSARQWMVSRIENARFKAQIAARQRTAGSGQLVLQWLKKQRLARKDPLARLEPVLEPDESA